MIVLDANILVALLDADDRHHDSAEAFLIRHAHSDLGASVVTIAEALVHPVRRGGESEGAHHLAGFGLVALAVDAGDAVPLARVRARFAIRMPDAIVLHTAVTHGAMLATFDAALVAAATRAGVEALPIP